MKQKHFTLLEVGSDAESDMIGTIARVNDSDIGKVEFMGKFIDAVNEHFDIGGFELVEMPDIFSGTWEVAKIKIEEVIYEIKILETWMY